MLTSLARRRRLAAVVLICGASVLVAVRLLRPVGGHRSARTSQATEVPDDLLVEVLDAQSGAPLPRAYFEPGFSVPDEPRRTADLDGTIRVPRALLAWLHEADPDNRGALVSEPDHASLPAWTIPEEPGSTSWQAWDAVPSVVVRLQPLPPATRRMRVRLLGEDGRPRPRYFLYVNGPSIEDLPRAPNVARSNPDGVAEFPAPPVMSLDIWDGQCLLGTYVLARGEEGAPARDLELPTPVAIHVRVTGIPAKAPLAFLEHRPVIRLDPDDRLGFARINGVAEPGWQAFTSLGRMELPVRGNGPHDIDVLIPRGQTDVLSIDPDDFNWAFIPLDPSKTVEIDVSWASLNAGVPMGGGGRRVTIEWSLTRAGLDGR